jgi:hypothetical protein
MKKFALKMVIGSLSLLFFFSACQSGSRETVTTVNDDGKPSVVIIEKTSLSLKITYSGTIQLMNDKSDFKSLSPKSYVNYKKGSTKLVVETSDTGVISYEFNNAGKKTSLNSSEKAALAEIIQDMLINGAKFQ